MSLSNKLGLASLVFCGALAVGGCHDSKNSEYNFIGEIDGEKINFFHNGIYSQNGMTVKENDGTTIVYYDQDNNDLKIEFVEFSNGLTRKLFGGKPEDKETIDKAQKKFDSYLPKILEAKKEEDKKVREELIKHLESMDERK